MKDLDLLFPSKKVSARYAKLCLPHWHPQKKKAPNAVLAAFGAFFY